MKFRVPLYETNLGPSQFVPTDPKLNAVLQNTEIPNLQPNGVTIEQMRTAPSLYTPNLSDSHRRALASQEITKNLPEIKKAASHFKQAKDSITPKIKRV